VKTWETFRTCWVSLQTYTRLYQVLCALPRSTLSRIGHSRVPVECQSTLYALLGGFMEMTSSNSDGLRAVCGIKSIHQSHPVLAFCEFVDFDTSTTEYYLISAKTSLFISVYGGSWSFILSLSIIFMRAFMPAASSFSFYPLSLFHPKSTLALALRVRDDTGPS